MSTSALPPSALTTLVIVLGASVWPNSPGFQASEAFMHAAQGFRDYMLEPHGFGLPTANLLDQFDAQASSSDQLEMLGSFLEERTQTLKAANQAVRDVLVYFVGHGGFAGPSADFYLMPRRTNTSSLRASGMSIDAQAEVLREKARQTRRYLFLDCCFAAAAFRSFQGGPDQTAITKTLDAFRVQARSRGFPRKGTVLLCSSDHKSPSLLLPDESCTMFSRVLLDVLRDGDLHRLPQLSLRDIKELAEDRLAALPEKNAPRPGLYSPDQSEGDVADVPFFPNPHAEEERRRQAEEQAHRIEEEQVRKANEEEHVRRAEEERRRQTEEGEQAHRAKKEHLHTIEEQIPPMLSQMFPPTPSSEVVMPPQNQDMRPSDVPPQAAAITSQRSVTLPPQPILGQPKRRHSPSVFAVLILLSLILLGGGSLGIYDVATGNWPWLQNISHKQPNSISPGIGTRINATSTAQANATSTAQANARIPGRVWHIQNSDTTDNLDGVAWSGSQFVAVGLTGTILTSSDGIKWATHQVNASFRGVAWCDSLFVAVGESGAIFTSPSGSTWSVQHSSVSNVLYDVGGSRSLCVAVGSLGKDVLISSNGSNWTMQYAGYAGVSQDLGRVIWSGSQFVASGPGGLLITSPNGITWTTRNSETDRAIVGLAWSGSLFVAVGTLGTILTSPNGTTWTARSSRTSQDLNSVVWVGSLFVAVGSSGTVLTSSDGITWKAQYTGTPQFLSDVVGSGSLFVAVGDNGTILTSL